MVELLSIRNDLLEAREEEDRGGDYGGNQPDVYERVAAILDSVEKALVIRPKPGK